MKTNEADAIPGDDKGVKTVSIANGKHKLCYLNSE